MNVFKRNCTVKTELLLYSRVVRFAVIRLSQQKYHSRHATFYRSHLVIPLHQQCPCLCFQTLTFIILYYFTILLMRYGVLSVLYALIKPDIEETQNTTNNKAVSSFIYHAYPFRLSSLNTQVCV